MFELSDSAVKRRLEGMVKRQLLRRIGSDRGGHWEVVKNV